MSDTLTDLPYAAQETTRQQEAAARERARRAGYTSGLRQLADLIDKHSDLPLPTTDTIQWFFVCGNAAGAMAAAAKVIPCKWSKHVTEGDPVKGYAAWYDLRGSLGGLSLELTAHRDQVCVRKVVGEKTVEVPDPDAPKVTKTVDVVEWECVPLLAAAERDSA